MKLKTVYQLPMTFEEFEAYGWTFDGDETIEEFIEEGLIPKKNIFHYQSW